MEEDHPDFYLFWLYSIVKDFDYLNGFSYLNLVEAYRSQGNHIDAIKAYNACKQSGFGFYAFYDDPDFKLGNLYIHLKNYDQALECYKEAKKIFSHEKEDLAHLAFFIGLAYHYLDNLSSALENYKNCLNTLNDDDYCSSVLAKAHVVENIQRAIDSRPPCELELFS